VRFPRRFIIPEFVVTYFSNNLTKLSGVIGGGGGGIERCKRVRNSAENPGMVVYTGSSWDTASAGETPCGMLNAIV